MGRTDRPPHVGHAPPDVVGGCGVRNAEIRAHVQNMTDKSSGMTGLYSAVVKTAVSIPDPIFAAADRIARRRQVSRSELYATALAELIARDSGADVTARLDAVYSDVDSSVDPALVPAQLHATREDW